MKMRMINLTRSREGDWQLTLSTRDRAVCDLWDDLHDDDVRVEPRRWHNRRSLDANNYAWLLIDKLAEKLDTPKVDIYREAIRGIGGVSDTCCVTNRAVDSLINGWRHNGLGWFAETMPSKIEGCTNVILYRGSSTYDSKQMSRLIDILVEECKQQQIETLPPHEIEAMNERWGARA